MTHDMTVAEAKAYAESILKTCREAESRGGQHHIELDLFSQKIFLVEYR